MQRLLLVVCILQHKKAMNNISIAKSWLTQRQCLWLVVGQTITGFVYILMRKKCISKLQSRNSSEHNHHQRADLSNLEPIRWLFASALEKPPPALSPNLG